MAKSRILHIDGGAGASGDMILGALLDLGVPLARVRSALATLPVRGYRLSQRRVLKEGIAACQVTVEVKARQPERNWREIRQILRGGKLAPEVLERASAVFRRLVEAEASVHGQPVERTHLHEVGAVDAIVDVVGACLALSALRVDRIVVSQLTTGFGTVQCEHGLFPVPAPATALLVRGVPTSGGELPGERLTPTGAAILTTVADAWGPPPAFRPLAIGYGAGTKEFAGAPNVLRMTLGETEGALDADAAPDVLVLEATLDDIPAQTLAYAIERLFAAGALEVFQTPVLMKKGRAGILLTVLGHPESFEALVGTVFRETTTLGLRYRRDGRVELAREIKTVRTPYGRLRVKVGSLQAEALRVWPEFEDCAAAARKHGVPLARVQQAALDAYARSSGRGAAPKRATRRSATR